MLKKATVCGMSVVLALAVTGVLNGCKKAEQAKEEVKPVPQQETAAPQAATATKESGSPIAVYTFEDGTQKWFPRKGVKIAQDTTQARKGKGCLKLAGTAASGEWDFAQSPRINLVAGKHYKFSGWVRVDSFEPTDAKTFCWLRLTILKDKQLVKNIISNDYNLKKKGDWRLLSAEFDAPADSNLTGLLTIDKRPQDKSIAATIYLDDVKIVQTN